LMPGGLSSVMGNAVILGESESTVSQRQFVETGTPKTTGDRRRQQ